jgi:MazG family protein
MSSSRQPAGAVERLDELTRRLRRECPWDREQDERSIVPHTVEEAYELADAANAGDDRKLLDELGDVLFQVVFLSILLEERGAGDLAAVAEHCREKLIRRHPHVFGEVEVSGTGEVLANWDEIKRGEEGRGEGVFADVPEKLPATLYARKLQRRASSGGAAEAPGSEAALTELREAAERLAAAPLPAGGPAEDPARDERFEAVGELLFAGVAAARAARVDPELALRAAAARFRERIERAQEVAPE